MHSVCPQRLWSYDLTALYKSVYYYYYSVRLRSERCCLDRYNVDAGDTGIDVGCVVRFESGLLERSDLEVCRVDQLAAGSLLDEGEELVSNVIHIRASVVVAVSTLFYTVSQKNVSRATGYNSANCWSIFKIFSLLKTRRNLLQVARHISNHTLLMLLHFLGKLKVQSC